MVLIPDDGKFERYGRLTPNGSQQSYRVHCDLQALVVVALRVDPRRPTQLQGKITPVPEGLACNVRHTLDLESGDELDCWLINRGGDVLCQTPAVQNWFFRALVDLFS